MKNIQTQPAEYVFDMATLQKIITRTNLTSMAVSVDDICLIEQLRSGNTEIKKNSAAVHY